MITQQYTDWQLTIIQLFKKVNRFEASIIIQLLFIVLNSLNWKKQNRMIYTIVSCQGSAQHNTVNNGVTEAVFIVLVFVAVALALIIFGMLIFCKTKQKQKRKIGDAQMVAMRDDDGCACENAVKGKDAWCAKNKWDGTCENHAKKICSNSFTECQGYNTAYHSLCFYKEGEAQLDEAGKFEVVQCIDNHGFASYQYIEYSMFNETESRTEYWLHFDSQTSQWIISEDMISIYGEYVCDERDILQCTAGKWKVSYIDIDAVMFINDDNAVIVSCQGSAQHNTVNNDGVTEAVFIVLVFVAVALALIIFGMLIFCQTKQKQKRKIGDAQMVAMRDDDGCACDETNKNMRETIEVEMDPLTH